MGWIGGQIAENWQAIFSFPFTWILPFVVVFGAILLGYRRRDLRLPIKKGKGALLRDSGHRCDQYGSDWCTRLVS